MAECCNDNLSKVFCDAFNKYYNTLYANGEISNKETDNLLVISYLRKLFINPRYIDYRPILIKALRCIADRSCLLDSSQLYGRLDIKTVSDKFVTVLMRDIYSIKETDPTVPLYVKDITQLDITNWNNKLSSETDPVFTASPAASITTEDISNWNNPPSGSGALIVTITLDGTYSADTTFADMLTAWNSGLDLIVYYSDAVYQVSWIDDGGAWFFRTDKTNAGPYIDYFAVDGTDDTWTKNTYNLQTRLTFDDRPTLNSNNPVKSSGIYNLCPIIEDTRSSAVAAITGVAPFSSLVDGQLIIIRLANNTVNNTSINLTFSNNTATGDIPVYIASYMQSEVRLGSGFFRTNEYMLVVYDSARSRWKCLSQLDTKGSYTAINQSLINIGSDNTGRVISAKIFHDNAYIVEEAYTSGDLKANKFYDFGTVSSLTIPSLDATNDLVSNALNFYALRFIAGADDLNITFPTGVIVDDEPTINTGDYVEIMINLYVENSTNHFYASIKVWQAQSQNS